MRHRYLTRRQRRARSDARFFALLSLLALVLAALATVAAIALYPAATAGGNPDAHAICGLLATLAFFAWVGFPLFAIQALIETRQF